MAPKSQLNSWHQSMMKFSFIGGKTTKIKTKLWGFINLNIFNHFNSKRMPSMLLVLKWPISSKKIVNDSFFTNVLFGAKLKVYKVKSALNFRGEGFTSLKVWESLGQVTRILFKIPRTHVYGQGLLPSCFHHSF